MFLPNIILSVASVRTLLYLGTPNIIPGEIAMFKTTFVLAIAVLMFEIVIVISLWTIVSFTIVRKTSCVCKDFAHSQTIDHLSLSMDC